MHACVHECGVSCCICALGKRTYCHDWELVRHPTGTPPQSATVSRVLVSTVLVSKVLVSRVLVSRVLVTSVFASRVLVSRVFGVLSFGVQSFGDQSFGIQSLGVPSLWCPEIWCPDLGVQSLGVQSFGVQSLGVQSSCRSLWQLLAAAQLAQVVAHVEAQVVAQVALGCQQQPSRRKSWRRSLWQLPTATEPAKSLAAKRPDEWQDIMDTVQLATNVLQQELGHDPRDSNSLEMLRSYAKENFLSFADSDISVFEAMKGSHEATCKVNQYCYKRDVRRRTARRGMNYVQWTLAAPLCHEHAAFAANPVPAQKAVPIAVASLPLPDFVKVKFAWPAGAPRSMWPHEKTTIADALALGEGEGKG